MNINEIDPGVADMIVSAYDGKGKYQLDHMTVVVKGSGPQLHDFVYSFPGQTRLMAAKHATWKFMKTHKFKQDQVISFLCLCYIKAGYKCLIPVAVLEISDSTENAVHQSRRWNSMLVNGGPKALLGGLLNETQKTA